MEITDQEKILITIAKILDDLKIEYFITGGFAVSVWGRPRATFDIDVIIKLVKPNVTTLARALRGICKAGYVDENMMADAISNNGEFNFIDPNSGLKVDFWVMRKEGLDVERLKNKKTKIISGQKVYFSSPEDLILSKLEWYKECRSSRHLEDVESIFKISGDKLDKKYLNKWVDKLGLSDFLDKVKNKL